MKKFLSDAEMSSNLPCNYTGFRFKGTLKRRKINCYIFVYIVGKPVPYVLSVIMFKYLKHQPIVRKDYV
jgi:hypothetical protein